MERKGKEKEAAAASFNMSLISPLEISLGGCCCYQNIAGFFSCMLHISASNTIPCLFLCPILEYYLLAVFVVPFCWMLTDLTKLDIGYNGPVKSMSYLLCG